MKKTISLIGLFENETDNVQNTINEDLIASAAREGKLVASELEGYLKMMMKDSKTAENLTKSGIRTSEELLNALKGNKLNSALKGSLELSVLKSNTKNAKLIDLASENLVRNKMFDQKYAAEFAKGQPAYEKALKSAGYSDDAITKIVQKKFNQIDPKTGKPYARPETINAKGGTSTNRVKPTTPPPAEVKGFMSKFGDKLKELMKKKPNWKTLVMWGAGLGISGLALWWMIDSLGGEKPTDMPPTPPVTDNGNWAKCIQDLINNKEGIVGVSSKGETSVTVKDNTYPDGVQFYSNGRVFNVKTKEMGTWKCKGGKTTIAEQATGTIDDATMDSYVNDAVDDLDGYVAEYNLKSLYRILTNLNGKTYNGQNALQAFLSYYKQDEGVDFVTDVNSVGVANLSVTAKNLKPKIIALAQGKGSTGTAPAPSPNTTGKNGLSGIEITWDGKKGGSVKDRVKTGKKRTSKFHDCSEKPLPHEFGCRSVYVRQAQACLGLPSQYQTGNFGPKTKQAIEDLGLDISNGLTQNLLDQICKDKKDLKPAEIIKTARPLDIKPVGIDPSKMKMPDIKSPYAAGQNLYAQLSNDGTLFESGGRLKYKGEALSQQDLDELNKFVSTLGYVFMKEKEKEDYGMKYVWVKR